MSNPICVGPCVYVVVSVCAYVCDGAGVCVSVCVYINGTGASCIEQILCCVAASRYCAVQRLAALVLCSLHRIASRVLGRGLPLRCCALDCRYCVVQRLADQVLCTGLPLVL